MARPKKEKIEETTIVETPIVPTESTEKTAFRKLIQLYKEQNPVKYEQKGAELEKKLAAL